MGRQPHQLLADPAARLSQDASAGGRELSGIRPRTDQYAVPAVPVSRLDHQLVQMIEHVRALLGIAADVGHDIVEYGLFAQVVLDQKWYIGVEHLVVGNTVTRRVRQAERSRLNRSDQGRPERQAVGGHGGGQLVLVKTPVQDVDPPRSTPVETVDHAACRAVLDDEVARFDERHPHLLCQQGVLEVGRVVRPVGEHRDRRLPRRPGGSGRDEGLVQERGYTVEPGNPAGRNQIGQHRAGQPPPFDGIGDSGGNPQVVLKNEPVPVGVAHQVDAGDAGPHGIRGHREPGGPHTGRVTHRPGRDHTVADGRLLAIGVVQEGLECSDALRQTRPQPRPVRGLDDTWHQIEGKRPRSVLAGHPEHHPAQDLLDASRLGAFGQHRRPETVQGPHHGSVRGTDRTSGVDHLVEAVGAVPVKQARLARGGGPWRTGERARGYRPRPRRRRRHRRRRRRRRRRGKRSVTRFGQDEVRDVGQPLAPGEGPPLPGRGAATSDRLLGEIGHQLPVTSVLQLGSDLVHQSAQQVVRRYRTRTGHIDEVALDPGASRPPGGSPQQFGPWRRCRRTDPDRERGPPDERAEQAGDEDDVVDVRTCVADAQFDRG